MVGRFLDDLISRALLALERAEIEFAVCGGVAMVASGRERGTRDLDVLVSRTTTGPTAGNWRV